MMIEFEEALRLILDSTKELAAEKVSVDDSAGRVLMEDVYSGIDMPPFNKSAMDGYALKAKDVRNIPVKLKCVGAVQAGEGYSRKVGSGECVKIMTGAGLPQGTDTVAVLEDICRSGKYVKIMKPVKKWKNVCFQGEDIKSGRKVMKKRTELSTSDIALLATVGKAFVKVVKRPEVAVLNTGGEIVPAGNRLSKRRIYNSNGPLLLSLIKSDGISPRFLGISKDSVEELTKAIRKGFESDILLISGGVSVGDYDLVPGVLKKSGVRKLFHNVSTKPGRPLFFGTKGNKIVFGIPGNPVSNFLAYNIYIRSAVYKMMGRKQCAPEFGEGHVEEKFSHRVGRKHFVLAKIKENRTGHIVAPVKCNGSADTLALSKANGFMVVDTDVRSIRAGSKVKYLTWK